MEKNKKTPANKVSKKVIPVRVLKARCFTCDVN